MLRHARSTLAAGLVVSMISLLSVTGTALAAPKPPPGPQQPGPLCFGKVATIVLQPPPPNTNPLPFYGTEGDDVIIGTEGNDAIITRAGADLVCGRGGDDTLSTDTGHAGADPNEGTPIDDRVDGGPGNDRIFTQDGYDILYGGEGDDFLHDPYSATFVGGPGIDEMRGASGNDTFDAKDGLPGDTMTAGADDTCIVDPGDIGIAKCGYVSY